MKKLKKIPYFKTEAEERRFWQTHDSTEYINWAKARHVRFPNLKLSTKPITIRLPEVLIEKVKVRANKMDVPYQTLIKQLIFEGITK